MKENEIRLEVFGNKDLTKVWLRAIHIPTTLYVDTKFVGLQNMGLLDALQNKIEEHKNMKKLGKNT